MKTLLKLTPAALLLLGAACNPSDSSAPVVDEAQVEAKLAKARELRSGAFANGNCTIQTAYLYQGTLPFKKDPEDDDDFFAVIFEASGYNEHFDFRDVDLLDGTSDKLLARGGQIWVMKDAATVNPATRDTPDAPGPAHVLMLFAGKEFPKQIKLGYWDKPLVTEAFTVAGSGPDLFKKE